MKLTSGNFFLDTNVILYSFDIDKHKKKIAEDLLASSPTISPQVVFECLNVAVRKFKLIKSDVLDFLRLLIKYSIIQE